MEMSNDIWTKINKVNHLPELNINNEAMILLKINDFNSYYLTTYEFYKKMTHTPSLSFDIFITEIDKSIPGAIYNQFAHNIQSTNQMERDALCRYIKEEYAFYFGYTFTVGDAYYLISWIIYNKYIMTYLISLYNCLGDISTSRKPINSASILCASSKTAKSRGKKCLTKLRSINPKA